ncbi:MAG: response regulator transcription factor [Sulfurovum sp.]|nr:response regulator transcription factor [Sulfurovum sp.]MCB4779109.1 response regulator transcription factor [Sulfurovum sp.]
MMKILLLEDDKLFNETLEDFLEEEGFDVDVVMDPYSTIDLIYERKYDLYLFDVNLPYESGFDLLRKLRESGDATPTLFLTSREDKPSMIQGFSAGADDYMRKPIDMDELLLRIQAILRRQVRKERLTFGDYMVDMVSKVLYKDGKELEITQKAVNLLVLLIEFKGEVVTFEMIKDRLWAAGQSASDGSMRVYITQLKKYFPNEIINIWGIGYRWECGL